MESILELNNLNAIRRAEKRGIYKRCLLKDKQEQLNSAKDNYGKDSYTYRSINEAEQDRYLDLLKLVILETKEPIEIDIDYSKDKHRIRAIDIRI